MAKVANVFKDGEAVIIRTTATKPNGDKLPQAGRRGIVTGTPNKDRRLVDVIGMPLLNVHIDDLDVAGALVKPLQTQTVTDVVAKSPTPPAATPEPAAPAAPALAPVYAFEVLLLTQIVPSLTNPRAYFEPVALASLADDIRHNGILAPILVRKLPAERLAETFSDRRKGQPLPGYEIVAGERRYRAAGMAGVRSVPVLIRELTDEQVLRMQLIENMQREDLHPLEEGQGYRRILDLDSQSGKSMELRVQELADGLRKSTRYIYQTIQLLKLSDFPKRVFLEGKLARSTALQIATIGNEAGQIEATRRIAGLGRTGSSTEVIDEPMSQRKAEDYVKNNHRLLLSKAPFSIRIAIAGTMACLECPTMSGNVSELFDSAAPGPNTCLDAICYGKKNTAHSEEIAEIARRKGQRVISGAEAKKIIPYEGSEAHLQGAYSGLNEKAWDVKPELQGQSYRQLLGADMPKPVLIANPHKGGFVEALPSAEIKRLLQERGLMRETQGEKDRKAERENKLERAYCWEAAAAVLTQAGLLDDGELFDDLVLPVLQLIYRRLDSDSTKRVHKLMGWQAEPIYDTKTQRSHLEALDDGDKNKFLLAALMSGDINPSLHSSYQHTNIDAMCDVVGIDPKPIKVRLLDEAKAAVKAKAGKAAAKAKPATPAAPKPSNKTQWREIPEDESKTLQAGLRVRVTTDKKKLPAKVHDHAGKVGTLMGHCGPEAYFLKIEGESRTADSFHYTELKIEVAAPAAAKTKPAKKQPAEYQPDLLASAASSQVH
jgi:ParB/RepB/Spo0J family partition protein